jgi:hypothetical protein
VVMARGSSGRRGTRGGRGTVARRGLLGHRILARHRRRPGRGRWDPVSEDPAGPAVVPASRPMRRRPRTGDCPSSSIRFATTVTGPTFRSRASHHVVRSSASAAASVARSRSSRTPAPGWPPPGSRRCRSCTSRRWRRPWPGHVRVRAFAGGSRPCPNGRAPANDRLPAFADRECPRRGAVPVDPAAPCSWPCYPPCGSGIRIATRGCRATFSASRGPTP